MLGVLKRRWKPKRASNAARIPGEPYPIEPDKPRLVASSVRQVHPVCEDKAQLIVYDKRSSIVVGDSAPKRPPPAALSIEANASPPPYPKRASLDSNPSPTSYPLAPNICVEAGRIEFIKQSPDGGTASPPSTPSTPRLGARITVTRGQQTVDVEYEEMKTRLETRIAQLEAALDVAQKTELRDKQLLSKLQKQLSRREAVQRDADRERRLRADCEARTKQALQEAARCKSRLKLLTNEFSRMEETVRSMLVYKKQAEQLRQEKAALTVAFESRCQHYQSTINRLNQEITTLKQQVENNKLQNLECTFDADTATALHRHAEESRKQYERCLDDVANQVVRALLAQKGLREEIGTLNHRIEELEQQNCALTSMLVHQLKGDTSSLNDFEDIKQLALEESPKEGIASEANTSADASPTNLLQTSLNIKHCNSFNSDVLEPSKSENDCDSNTKETALSRIEKHLSADSEVLDTRLSLEDKKRHQVLTKLWTELKGSEVTPKRLIEALSTIDSTLWVPPPRPVSLNLQIPIIQATKYRKTRPFLAQTSSKSEEETTGNESPESGNRDEGYSTMSSDVQTEVTRPSVETAIQPCGLEELKEASDETDVPETRLLVTDNKDPDILYIPLNLLNLKSRNSYPPGKEMLPFQHIMRSFSDSHLCIKITTAPSPCYTFSSPISSSPSILLLDITDKTFNPLKRAKGTTSLLGNTNVELCNTKSTWSSPAEERIESASWDAEYVQQWLRLDETRSVLQQHHRDMLELEYDKAELEDWSLSLSNEDLREQWKKLDVVSTPGQISITTLPSIQENNALELEEDSSECLWNNPSYMMDRDGHELVAFLMDNLNNHPEKSWPYGASNTNNSPDNSWSSGASDCCQSHEPETCSKRSSAALSGCSDDTSELPAIGTDFTRDFYRLVKFESTKSLASTSSRSLGGALSENGDRETTLQNVLTYLAEQQKYVNNIENSKDSRPCSVSEVTKEFNIEAPPQEIEELKISDFGSDLYISNKNNVDLKSGDNDENYVSLKQLCTEYTLNEQNSAKDTEKALEELKQNIAYAEEICLVTPLDVESENCSNITEHPVDICSSVNVELNSTDYQCGVLDETVNKDSESREQLSEMTVSGSSDLVNSSDTISGDNTTGMSESLTSSVSTPDTVVSKIPRRKHTPSRIPVSPAKQAANNINNNSSSHDNSKIPKSKIAQKTTKISKPSVSQKQKIVHVKQNSEPQHVITSEKLPQSTSGYISNIIEGPPHRAVSFHERATSKDVIDELNRIIKNGEENNETNEVIHAKLDEACRPTGWIHVERDIDLTDPKARANLLDVMMASVSSDSSPTSSCGGSITSDSTEDHPDYGQLHRIHRFHRQKKAHAVRPELAVVRAAIPISRPTIIGRPDFYIRYGEKEREAVASFDFLDELSTTSSSLSDSPENCPKAVGLKVTEV